MNTRNSNVIVRVFGDICSDRMYKNSFVNGDIEGIFGFTKSLIDEATLSIANLECPLTDNFDPIRKTGPCLIGPVETATVLVEAGFDAVGLANNHILDQNVSGLKSTIRLCKEAGLQVVGAGVNLDQAREPLVIEKGGVKFGIYCMAESEFSIASKDQPGANDIQAVNWIPDLTKLKRISDYVIVLLHTGKEHYRLPTPRQQKLCREITTFGANLVVCQHSHCIGATEEYMGSHIIYGQGNFIFGDSGKEPESWLKGVVVEVTISSEKSVSLKHIYYKQVKESPHISLLSSDEFSAVTKVKEVIDRQVLQPDEIKKEWHTLSLKIVPNLLYTLGGFEGNLLRILRKLKIHRFLYKGKTRLVVENLLRCQTHRELLEEYFDNY